MDLRGVKVEVAWYWHIKRAKGLTMKPKIQYKPGKHPKTGLWHVLGYCGKSKSGKSQWTPFNEGHETWELAWKQCVHYARADMAAKRELAI